MSHIAISNLHLVDENGNLLLENAQKSILGSRFELGVFASFAELTAKQVAPLQHAEAYLIDEDAKVRWVGNTWVYEVTRGSIDVLDNATTQIESKFTDTESVLKLVMLMQQGNEKMLKTYHVLEGTLVEGMSIGAEFSQFSVEYDAQASIASGLFTINLIGAGTGVSTSIKWIAKKVL